MMRTKRAPMLQCQAGILGFTCFLSALVQAADQYYSPTWVATAGGPADDWGAAVAIDDQGNSYVTGAFDDEAEFGSIVAPPQADEVLVAKLNSQGTWQWVARPSGIHSHWGYDLAVAPNGTVFVAGALRRAATFGVTTLTSSNSARRPFVAAINPEGEWIWAAQGSTTNTLQPSAATAVCLDNFGNVYLAGHFSRDVTFGSVTLTALVGVFVTKYDNTGNVAWAVHIPNSRSDRVAIDVDNAGNVYVAGGSSDADRVESHAFIAKLSPSGDQLWFSEALPVGQNVFLEGSGITADSAGNVYTTGLYFDDVSFGNIVLNGSPLGGRIFLAKADSNGEWVWATTLDGSFQDSDNLSLVGDETILVASKHDESTFLRLFDPNGNLQHRYRLQVPAVNTVIEHSELRNNGEVLLAGTLQENATQFSGFPVSPRNYDVFVAKLLPLDTDQDALSNYEEGLYGTNPDDSDTDGDGVLDGVEIDLGTDPLDAGDFPDLPVAIVPLGVALLVVSVVFVLKRPTKSAQKN